MPAITLTSPGPLAQVACGLRAQLVLAFPEAVFTHRWLPGRITRNSWEKLTQKLPVIGLGFNGFRRVETVPTLDVVTQWSALLATKNERGQPDLLFGDRFSPGQFTLAEAAAAVLHGYTLPGLGSIRVTEAMNVFIEEIDDPSVSITALDLTVSVGLPLSAVVGGEAVTPQALNGQAIEWYFGDATSPSLTDTTGTA